MEKVVAIITGIGIKQPDIMADVRLVADRFERLNGIPVKLITDEDVKDLPLVAPHFACYYAWQMVDNDVDRLICMDCDIIPFHALPKRLPDADFAAVPENSRWGDSAKSTIPLIKRAGTYFNSGLFIAKRSARPVFERMTARQTALRNGVWILDQTLLNVEVQTAVALEEITFEKLSKNWCMPFWDLRPGLEPSMVHYLSLTNLIKMRLVGRLIRTLNALETEATGAER
jgi:hypothetical protein